MGREITDKDGPEIVGMRITVYNLVPYFLDPEATEQSIADSYELTVEQVAAARAYVFAHFDKVMARHREIEERNARGNPPEVLAIAEQSRARFQLYREWYALHLQSANGHADHSPSQLMADFQEWAASREVTEVADAR